MRFWGSASLARALHAMTHDLYDSSYFLYEGAGRQSDSYLVILLSLTTHLARAMPIRPEKIQASVLQVPPPFWGRIGLRA